MARGFLVACFTAFLTNSVIAGDLDLAPPAFDSGGKHIVPVDFQTEHLALKFNIPGKKATGRAVIEFEQGETGYAMFDLVAKVTALRLDGMEIGADKLPEVAPDSSTRFRYLNYRTEPGSHTLTVDYDFPSEHVTFSSTGVRVGFFMSDVGDDRAFLEQYAPANFEFDSFTLTVDIELEGARAEHRIFANGHTHRHSREHFTVEFPKYFSTSSVYLHLTEKSLQALESNYQGLEKNIPITVYTTTGSNVSSAMSRAKAVLKELENDYGPYAHETLVVHLTNTGGGMEHCGATMTTDSALGHEITHSWFARGYMPANGNAGWIDEAIASWRDYGYGKPSSLKSRPPVHLASFSPYRRTTPNEAYDEGEQLISELTLLVNPNMKGVLKAWFREKKYLHVHTSHFQEFLEKEAGKSLANTFDRYVMGKNVTVAEYSGDPEGPSPRRRSRHPRRYTRDELKTFR